jgi:hypothetical protein
MKGSQCMFLIPRSDADIVLHTTVLLLDEDATFRKNVDNNKYFDCD